MPSFFFAAPRHVALLLALLIAPALPAHADDAATLAQAVFDRPAGRDLTTVGRMELTEKGRAPRRRELVTYRWNKAPGESASLIRFFEPQDIAGTGLLSVDKADGTNDQWLYLPGLDRVRKVAGDRKGGRFVGSDLYYEDLQTRRPSKDRHRLIGKETIAGVPCEVLESVPVEPSSSVYRKRVSWIDRQTMLVMRVDYYERDDNAPTKRWLMAEKKKFKDYWTVTDSRVTDLATGHETRLVAAAVHYDRSLPAKLFTAQALADEGLESEFRP
jgi:hypothetical protein